MTQETYTQRPIPIIVGGRTEKIGEAVIVGLKPEYEGIPPLLRLPIPVTWRVKLTPHPPVVHFVLGAAAITEIPTFLNGQVPSDPSSTLGSGNLSERPVAVALGGGFVDTFDEVHDGVDKALGASGGGLAWLRHDGSKPGPAPGSPGYGESVAQRIKDTLAGLEGEGKLGGGQAGVYWF